jgi:arylsulfatase A-like enzyme
MSVGQFKQTDSGMLPNIVLIMTDQQRFDSLSAYGCRCISTPNIDSIAEKGVIFDNCYADNPVCTPSRASIFTGKPIVGHNVYRLHDNLPVDEKPFTWHLQQAGYSTALFGKLHLSSRIFEDSHRHPHDGFDVYMESKSPYLPMSKLNGYLPWLQANFSDVFKELQEKKRKFGNFPEEAHLSTWVASSAVDFLDNHDQDKPFFCYASFFDPHDPYNDYPLSMEARVDRSRLMDVIHEPDDWDSVPEGMRREHFHGYLGNAAALDVKTLEEIRMGYYASVAFIDRQVGRILECLEKQGLRDNTMIIFTSDHGDMLGDHGLLAKGAFFYEPCTKVPLIISSPTIDARSYGRCSALVQGHDIASTILAYAGLNDGECMAAMPDSIDLHAVVNGTVDISERPAICLYRGTSIDDTKRYFDPPINAGMLRYRQYKLNLYFSTETAGASMEGQLFDLSKDPYELADLFADAGSQDLKNRLIALFLAHLNTMDFRYNKSRGGENFPGTSHWSQNNPL